MAEWREGDTAVVRGLEARRDLNGASARLLAYDADKQRWAVQILSHSSERVRVRAHNLHAPHQSQSRASEPTEEDDEAGVYVRASLGGKRVAIDPAALKSRFTAVVAKYGFDKGSRSDEIADFMTSAEVSTISAAQFAARFSTSDEDAEVFLAWVSVGVAFKEQYMQDLEGGSAESRAAAAKLGEAAGVL